MSNPVSPSPAVHPSSSESALSDTGKISSSTENGSGNGNKEFTLAAHMDPVVRLSQLELKEPHQVQQAPAPVPVQKRKSSTGILSKSSGSSASSSLNSTVGSGSTIIPDLSTVKMEAPMEILPTLPSETLEATNIPTTPSIVKPRRPSVHFAVDSEPKMKSVMAERSKQDGGSRKHRSRKEKLVCRRYL